MVAWQLKASVLLAGLQCLRSQEKPNRRQKAIIEAKELALRIARIAKDNKAQKLVVLDLQKLAAFCDFFVIMTGTSNRHIAGVAEAIDEELYNAMYLKAADIIKSSGYNHYEVSNFALPGYESKHNLRYWSYKPYYGFGPGAHSFDVKRRRWNFSAGQGERG